MVTETYDSTLNINLNQQQIPPKTACKHEHRHMPVLPVPARVKTKVLAIKKRGPVLVGSGRSTSILAGIQWHTSENGKTCHFQISSRCMCKTSTRTRACNKYIHVILFLSYKIRSGVTVKQIHRH